MGIRSRKNKKAVLNANGIEICDSMVMSVKKKNINFRKVQAVGIAVAGFVSAVMSFLTMFDFRYDSTAVHIAVLWRQKIRMGSRRLTRSNDRRVL